MDDDTIWLLLVALVVYFVFFRKCEGTDCACASCATSSGPALPATGVPPLPGTGTAQGTQPSVAMQLCQAGAKAGAAAGASAAGVPPQVGTAAATPGLTSTVCSYIGKGLVIAEHGIVAGAKDVGKAGAAVGKFVGHETASAAKATAHVTATAVKDVAKGVGKVGSGLESGVKSATHAVSSGIHKVLSFL